MRTLEGVQHHRSTTEPDDSEPPYRHDRPRQQARQQEARTAGVDRRQPLTLSTHRLYPTGDRKSTRLNSSHSQISYAVFCLKKKKNKPRTPTSHHTSLSATISAVRA